MGKFAPLLTQTVNSPATIVKHFATKRGHSGFVWHCMMTRLLLQQSISQAKAHQELSEPGWPLSPAAQCSGTESRWSPSPPTHPASLCRPSPQCTATQAAREAPAYSAAVSNPVRDRKEVPDQSAMLGMARGDSSSIKGA